MKLVFSFAMFGVLISAIGVFANDSAKSKDPHQVVQATYMITGLHCPACTRTVESSLGHVDGIRGVKVDWKTKNARIEFDESILPAQKVARLIADTPHMMGKNMHYDGWLALKVSEIENAESTKPVADALQKLEGVKHVTAYPKQHSVTVQFDSKGQVTDAQLISALAKAGFHAANL